MRAPAYLKRNRPDLQCQEGLRRVTARGCGMLTWGSRACVMQTIGQGRDPQRPAVGSLAGCGSGFAPGCAAPGPLGLFHARYELAVMFVPVGFEIEIRWHMMEAFVAHGLHILLHEAVIGAP